MSTSSKRSILLRFFCMEKTMDLKKTSGVLEAKIKMSIKWRLSNTKAGQKKKVCIWEKGIYIAYGTQSGMTQTDKRCKMTGGTNGRPCQKKHCINKGECGFCHNVTVFFQLYKIRCKF